MKNITLYNSIKEVLLESANKKKKDWIGKAIKKPGTLRELARVEGAIKDDGSIDINWLKKKAKQKNKTGYRARLALTLRKIKKK